MSQKQIHISCHCGLNTFNLTPDLPPNKHITLCDCNTCRHTTGQLCTSYLPIQHPEKENAIDTSNLIDYIPGPTGTEVATGIEAETWCKNGKEWKLWFCKRCGSHVYRQRWRKQLKYGMGKEGWEVATGLVKTEDLRALGVRFSGHGNIASTRDGGLAKWLLGSNAQTQIEAGEFVSSGSGKEEGYGEDVLQGSCHCGHISFHITRPDEKSILPTSAFSDLIKHHTPPGLGYCENPNDEKWWLRSSKHGSFAKEKEGGGKEENKDEELTRYFAGICVCTSCRLSSGFEFQAWAFIPKSNIIIHIPSTSSFQALPSQPQPSNPTNLPSLSKLPLSSPHAHSSSDALPEPVPLDFTNSLIMSRFVSHGSREDVRRYFCPTCGATVFWTGERRSELIDVSVGLFRAPNRERSNKSWVAAEERGAEVVVGDLREGEWKEEKGVMASDWLDWCSKRVSFMEEVLGEAGEKEGRDVGQSMEKLGREGLVQMLIDGLRGCDEFRKN